MLAGREADKETHTQTGMVITEWNSKTKWSR